MLQLDYKDHRPLYEQIKEKMKVLIMSGVLKSDQQLPSVRELAQSLTINPNTIQKAYKDLETEGFIYSVRGKGNFVAELDDSINEPRRKALMCELEKIISELKYINTPKDRLISSINKIYDGTEENLRD